MKIRIGCKEFYHHASAYVRKMRAGKYHSIILLMHGVPFAEIKRSGPDGKLQAPKPRKKKKTGGWK